MGATRVGGLPCYIKRFGAWAGLHVSYGSPEGNGKTTIALADLHLIVGEVSEF